MMNTTLRKYYLPLFFIVASFLSTHGLSYLTPTDTLNTSQIFRDNSTSTLISSGGTFELGFFTPNNSNNRYLGMWYKKIPVRTIVWVANRDNPANDQSSALKVIEPGILALLKSNGNTIWSTNTSTTVQNPVALLLDSGNLVVKDANDDNPKNFAWQSFEHPTDTFLPGMKLGVNFQTGLEVYITSARHTDDPSSGDLTYHIDVNGYPQNVIKEGGLLRYSSGPWNGLSFSGSSYMSGYTSGVVINKEEMYYHYELLNDSMYSRFTITDAGGAQMCIWEYQKQSWTVYLNIPADNCDIYNICGAHGICYVGIISTCGCLNKFKGNYEDGCIRSTPLNCENGDAFFKYYGIKLPSTHNSWYNTTMTLKECKVKCLKNCSCMAYASLDTSRGENGCLLWFGDLVNIRSDRGHGQDIYIRLASSELDSTDSGGRKRKILTVIFSLVSGILLLSLSMILYSKKRKKLNHPHRKKGKTRQNNVNNHGVSHNEELELPLFELSTISKATNNFLINNKLGEGGFGPVYKGVLEDRQEIAVKRLSRTSNQGVDEFRNEVVCIAKLQHRNLVKLLGWCFQGDEMMLVYEYMTNKSLDIILFDPTKSMLLDWPRHFNIITSIARGLMYLHQDSRLRIIHRDLKASNILLDSDLNPKISDFGLARILGGNETGDNTRRVVGTYGYMSPEYATHGLFSVKSDVYSFRVLVLEIITGKRNKLFSHNDHHLDLLGNAWMLYREERSSELVDSCFRNLCNLSEVLRSIHIGLLCVQDLPEDRPSMSSVVQMLGNDNVLPESKHPGFFKGIDKQNETPSDNIACSSNSISNTLEAR